MSSPQTLPEKIEYLKSKDIVFDPDNPRFFRLNHGHHEIPEIIDEMFDEEGVVDLMLSIGQKGYFPGEPLLITNESGENIVIEGNRRLAAVKLLNGQISPPEKRQRSVKKIIEEVEVSPPKILPCLIFKTKTEVKRYLGYRHITGIKEWDSLSKALYLEDIRQEFYAQKTLAEQMQLLAKDIGSRSDYVAKLLTSLKIYQQAESSNFFEFSLNSDDIEFSYLTTAVGYSNISSWLGLEDSKDVEMQDLNHENVKRLFSWLFVKDQQNRTVIGESRNLKELAAIVRCDAAVEVLDETLQLNEAYLYSDGPEEALINAMESASKKLQTTWNLILKVKPFTADQLSFAEQLFDNSKRIRNHIRDELDD